MNRQLILASSSPRRQELLTQVKIPYDIRVADVDESAVQTTDPYQRVEELATLKGQSVPFHHDREVILAADTLIAHENKILEKPKDKAHARDMLNTLSGNSHDVLTGVMIRTKEKETSFVVRTKVEFWPLDPEDIERYIATDEPYDKAGAYGIQSLGAMFVKQLIGDYYNVMGLPLSKVVRTLKGFNIYANLSE